MNLKKVQKSLEKLFKDMNLGFTYEDDGKRLKATNDITIEGYDDDVTAILEYYPSGICSFAFIFDKLEATEEALELLNDFNRGVYGLKAFINDNDYLEVAIEGQNIGEGDVAQFAETVLNDLLDKDIEEYLLPLTELTE